MIFSEEGLVSASYTLVLPNQKTLKFDNRNDYITGFDGQTFKLEDCPLRKEISKFLSDVYQKLDQIR